MIKQELYRIKGVKNNSSKSLAEKDYAYSIHNFDLYANGDFLNIKSTKGYSFSGVTGIPSNLDILHHTVCEDDLIVFAKEKGELETKNAYSFNQGLGFSDNYVHLKEVMKDVKVEYTISGKTTKKTETTETITLDDLNYSFNNTTPNQKDSVLTSNSITLPNDDYKTYKPSSVIISSDTSITTSQFTLVEIEILEGSNSCISHPQVTNGPTPRLTGTLCKNDNYASLTFSKDPPSDYKPKGGVLTLKIHFPTECRETLVSNVKTWKFSGYSSGQEHSAACPGKTGFASTITQPIKDLKITFLYTNATHTYTSTEKKTVPTTVVPKNQEENLKDLNLSDGNNIFETSNDSSSEEELKKAITILKSVDSTIHDYQAHADYKYEVTINKKTTLPSDNSPLKVTTVSNSTQSGNTNYIYKVALNSLNNLNYTTTLLYKGFLNFKDNYKIKSVYDYVNSNLRFVYFTDGLNPLRVINITKTYEGESSYCFDFKPQLKGLEKVTINKNQNPQGLFSPGAVQYMFTYIKEDLSETNIAWVSPTLYTSFGERAGSPDESVQCSFTLSIENVNTEYKYLRLYSLCRSESSDVAKLIEDVEITGNTLTYCDTNTIGSNIESYSLLYKNFYNLKAKAINIKSGTLFVGGISEYNKNEEIPYNIVGGRNLVTNSKTYTFNKSSSNYNHKVLCTLELGCDYTVSIESSDLNSGNATEYSVLTYDYDTSKSGERHNFNISTSKVSYTFKNVQHPSLLLYQGPSGSTANNQITWTKIKVEKGPIATPWVPAIEDGPSDLWDNAFDKKLYIGENQRSGFNFYNGTDTCPLTFKLGQPYTLGIQLQTKEGVWEEPIISGLGGTWIPKKPFSYITQPLLSIDKSAFDKYIAIRPMIRKVTKNKRNWLMQGVVNSTVSNHSYYNNSNTYMPHVQSSWFYRSDSDTTIQKTHDRYLYNAKNTYGEEVQGVPINADEVTGPSGTVPLGTNYSEEAASTCQCAFKVRKDILTFNTLNTETNYKINDTMNLRKIYEDKNYTQGFSTYSTDCVLDTIGIDEVKHGFECYDNSPSGFWYHDGIADDVEGAEKIINYDKLKEDYRLFYWKVYPWQRSIINNDARRTDGSEPSSKIKTKRSLQKIYIYNEHPINSEKANISNTLYQLKDGTLFDQDTVSLVKIKDSKNNELIYYGNIDTLLNPGSRYLYNFKWSGYKHGVDTSDIGCFSNAQVSGQPEWCYYDGSQYKSNEYSNKDTDLESNGTLGNIGDWYRELRSSGEGIRMKYKSIPHYVLSVNTLSDYNAIKTGIYDITKPIEHDDNKDWIVAGEAVPLQLGSLLEWKYGDIFYGTTEFLHTYSFNSEDINQVISVISAPIESDTNMYGRYDKNINSPSYVSNPENFGKYNSNYNIINDFFVYRKEENKALKNISYNNYIAWSNNSASLEHNTALSNVSLASSMKAKKPGAVEELLLYNNDLYVFQKEAVNKLMYNSRVMVATNDGIPIEIANSQKVDDLAVISEVGGTKACVSSQGIFFIEEYSKDLMNYSSNGFVNISKNIEYNIIKEIKLLDVNTKNNKILLVHDGCATIYSYLYGGIESIVDGDFTKCFNYNSTYSSITKDGGKYFKVNKLFDSHYYNNGEVVYICNPEFQADKVFNTIDFRTEFYDEQNKDVWNKTWTSIYGSNEYQNSFSELIFDSIRPSNLKRKFRIWRAQVPRMDRKRLRNPWIQLTLKYNRYFENMLTSVGRYNNIPLRITPINDSSPYGTTIIIDNVFLEKGFNYIISFNSNKEQENNYFFLGYKNPLSLNKIETNNSSFSCYSFTPDYTDYYQVIASTKYNGIPNYTACIWNIKMYKVSDYQLHHFKPAACTIVGFNNVPNTITSKAELTVPIALKENTPYVLYIDAYGKDKTITVENSDFIQDKIEVQLDALSNVYILHIETKSAIGNNKLIVKGDCTVRSIKIEEDQMYSNNKLIHHDLVLSYSL